MKTNVKLPIVQPPITSHQFYALPLAIICTNQSSLNWIYGEFIQLFTYRDKEEEYTAIHLYNRKNDLFTYEPLEDIRITPRQLIYGERIVDIYKNLLDNRHYIYDFVDLHYIKCLNFRNNFIHDLLIYGYDSEKKIFNVFAYNGLKLAELEVPYEEYVAAYNSKYKANRFHLTILYRGKEEEYKVDIRKIKWYLLDYINGINTYNRENLNEVKLYKPQFGINVYDELIYMFNFQYNLKLQIRMPDLYCFYEHKKLMTERVIYLSQNSDIKCHKELLNEFKDAEADALKIVMLSIKINRQNFENKNDFDKLINRVCNLKEKEKIAYNKYHEYNKNVFNNI